MGISKTQAAHVEVLCQCGCESKFLAFPTYRSKAEGGGLRVPDFKRGHHPNCKKTQLSSRPVWNKGLRKETNAAVNRQGKRGLGHWNFDADQNPDWFAVDFDFVAFALKYGDKPRSKGGNKAYAKFRRAILARDKFTCQKCGLVDDDEESLLQVHHIVYVKHDRTRMFDPSNVISLCFNCHAKTHRGAKSERK